jgi:hypothetical protein
MRSTIPKIRSLLYTTAKLLGDVRAVQTGKVPERIVRRVAGKLTGRVLGAIGRIFR